VDDLVAAACELLAGQLEPQQRPRRMPGPIAGHDNRLLAKVATLFVRDRLGGPPNVEGEPVLVNVFTVNGRPGFDAQPFVSFKSGRDGARLREHAPQAGRQRV
jgi:hypothetical protein